MSLELRRLNLVKKYLVISLMIAMAPLITTALLYDRYSAHLLDNLLTQKIANDMQQAVIKVRSFIRAKRLKLENIADFPEVEQALGAANLSDLKFSTNLLDFLYLEAGDSDIYAIHFFDQSQNLIKAIPHSVSQVGDVYKDLKFQTIQESEISNPILPRHGRPGWFYIQKHIYKDTQKIGTIAFKIRLASLTGQLIDLYRPSLYEPKINFAGNTALSVVGTLSNLDKKIGAEVTIIPGWQLFLTRNDKDIEEPRVLIRYALMLTVAFASAAIIWLFLHMSERLARSILPLTEGAKAISRGQFSHQLNEAAPGELGTLARAFNNMSSQLEKMLNSRVDIERRAELGSLAAGIAHEIRNPLAIMSTSLHGLAKAETDDERKKQFELLINEIMRVDSTVDEFLAYARPRISNKEKIDVENELLSVTALIKKMASQQKVKMSTEIIHPAIINIDPTHFRQILINLTLNAIQAMPAGGDIAFKVEYFNDNAVISITDNGDGIEPETLKKVRRPFFSTKKKGTGLGLPICLSLVKANDGYLEIESEADKGTVVKISFPVLTYEERHEKLDHTHY